MRRCRVPDWEKDCSELEQANSGKVFWGAEKLIVKT